MNTLLDILFIMQSCYHCEILYVRSAVWDLLSQALPKPSAAKKPRTQVHDRLTFQQRAKIVDHKTALVQMRETIIDTIQRAGLASAYAPAYVPSGLQMLKGTCEVPRQSIKSERKRERDICI